MKRNHISFINGNHELSTNQPSDLSIDHSNKNADNFANATVDLQMGALYEPFLREIPEGGKSWMLAVAAAETAKLLRRRASMSSHSVLQVNWRKLQPSNLELKCCN
jgi:hypothetical protein